MKVLGLDVESTGSRFLSGIDTPFVLCGMDQDEKKYKWEWKFDPVRRRAIPSKKITQSIKRIASRYDLLTFHNGKFDLRALWSMKVNLDWKGKYFDTMIAAAMTDNTASKKLKDLGVKYLHLPKTEETSLKEAVIKCRRVTKKWFPDWNTAKGNSKAKDREGSDSTAALDYWLPKTLYRALFDELTHNPNNRPKDQLKELWKILDEHPEWETICDDYGYGDVYRTVALTGVFMDAMKKRNVEYAYRQEIRLLEECIYDMEAEGITLIQSNLKKLKKEFGGIKQEHLDGIKSVRDINPNSSKQLQEVMFGDPVKKNKLVVVKTAEGKKVTVDQIKPNQQITPVFTKTRRDSLKFKPLHTTKKGQNWSTDKFFVQHYMKEQNFQKLSKTQKKFLNHYHEYSDVSKAYEQLETLGEAAVEREGIPNIFCNVKQNGTSTTRMSYSDPNAQQIGKGKDDIEIDEDGNEIKITKYKIREVFGPRPGRVWYCIDYSQMQLRIFAVLANEKEFIEASMKDGFDAHDFVARKIFNIPPDQEPTKNERRIAKNTNFGFIFGASPKKIEATAGRPGLWDTVTSLFPNAHRYMEAIKRQVRKQHHVFSPPEIRNGKPDYSTSYRLYLPYGPNGRRKEHAGVNYQIQGCEGVIVKNAMIKTAQYLKSIQKPATKSSPAFNPKMIFVVHDEIIFDFPAPVKPHQHDKYLNQITSIMEKSGDLYGIYTPVEVDLVDEGNNWANGVTLIQKGKRFHKPGSKALSTAT